jgi:hypothetical protein
LTSSHLVKLTVVHEGGPAILANLTSLLETGDVLPTA